MRLNRLEISGFKSFPDRSELAFDTGVTAIVGPNGCGKSNVVDAITWVLGEQSAKSLRGDRMEDVIFSGSDARKPTSTAEVRLYLAGVTAGTARPAIMAAASGSRTVSIAAGGGGVSGVAEIADVAADEVPGGRAAAASPLIGGSEDDDFDVRPTVARDVLLSRRL